MTSRLTLNPIEVAAMLPALEKILNGIATLKIRAEYAGMEHMYTSKPVYAGHHDDAEMFQHLLTCRNKLKSINPSRKVRLNVFELAAAAFALRVARKFGLAPKEVDSPERMQTLARKLERYRKRAKRSIIRQLGPDEYNVARVRWRNFTGWIRLRLLAPAYRLKWPSSVSVVKKHQRNTMRQLVRDVVVDSTDEKDVRRWAELARWHIWRGRHTKRLREFLSDQEDARRFLAGFITDRADLKVLRVQYIPKCLRVCVLWSDRFKAVLVNSDEASIKSVDPVSSNQSSPAVASGHNEELDAAPPDPTTIVDKAPDDQATANLVLDADELVALLKTWFMNEVEPEYRRDVAKEIRFQVSLFSKNHVVGVASSDPEKVIEQCRPTDDAADSLDVINFFVDWGCKWLLALTSDHKLVCDAVIAALSGVTERKSA